MTKIKVFWVVMLHFNGTQALKMKVECLFNTLGDQNLLLSITTQKKFILIIMSL
jgi:hypothetical protein